MDAVDRFEFAVLGAGAMGSILAAHLARAGHSVALLARGRRAAQVRSEGLRISGLVELSAPVHVIDDPTQLREADVLIVATKAVGTAQSLQPLAGAGIGHAFSVQNGVLKNDLLRAAFGHDHVLGALANMSGELRPVATLSSGTEENAVRVLNDIGAHMREHSPAHRLSAHQDVDAGRPLEVEETIGHAARSAIRAGLSLPLLDAVYRIAAAIDRTSRVP